MEPGTFGLKDERVSEWAKRELFPVWSMTPMYFYFDISRIMGPVAKSKTQKEERACAIGRLHISFFLFDLPILHLYSAQD